MVIKINEFEARGDVEGELRRVYAQIADAEGNTFEDKFCGVAIALGPYVLQLLEY